MCRSPQQSKSGKETKMNRANANGTANAKESKSKKDTANSYANNKPAPATATNGISAPSTPTPQQQQHHLRRRRKRDKQQAWSKQIQLSALSTQSQSNCNKRIVKKKKKSKMTSKHADDSKSGGLDALIPSLIGVVIFAFVIMAKMGFRGRATTAGIDLGTTNSVICIQAPSKGVGTIDCIRDPATNSPVVPSVVSFLDNHHLRNHRLTKEEKERDQEWPSSKLLVPHPVDVVIGQGAKDRINSHPHHTIYHAKRIIGREINHESVDSLRGEVDFDIVPKKEDETKYGGSIAGFSFPYHMPLPPANNGDTNTIKEAPSTTTTAILSPSEIGSYIIHHLRTIARNHLGHDNVKSAVIAIPAKFDPSQRDATVRAYQMAGLRVARILEEPTAAALAYGLHKRDDVHYVMVYDFGGGTLDISLLYIGDGGYIDVLGSDGDEQLGGADFDAAVAHWLLERKGGEEIVHAVMASVSNIEERLGNSDRKNAVDVEDLIEELCPKLKEVPLCTISSFHTIGEQMKIGLSAHANEPMAVSEEVCYRLPDTVESVPDTAEELCNSITQTKLSLSLEEYDMAVDSLYKRSLLPIQRLLKDLDLSKDEVDEVVMVGGTTRMPQIRELVRNEMEKERLNTHIDPDLTVAYGAASVID